MGKKIINSMSCIGTFLSVINQNIPIILGEMTLSKTVCVNTPNLFIAIRSLWLISVDQKQLGNEELEQISP